MIMEKIEKEKTDYFFITLVILLVGFGLVMFFSASYYHSEMLGKNPLYLFNRQIIYVIIGIFLAFVASRFPLAIVKQYISVIVIVSLFISLLPFIPGVGEEIKGARRWIVLFDFSFQPSEFIKLTLILYLAAILSKKENRLDDPLNALLPPLIVISLFIGIIFLQNDFSTAVFIFVVSISMFFIAKIRLIYFMYLGTLVVPLGLLLLLTNQYWVQKVLVFFDPSRDPFNTGYQIKQSRAAFILGGFFGRGFGMSSRKLGFLPEADSDFIFAVSAEETGFIGVFIIILLFLLFTIRGYVIAHKSRDSFTYYLGFGITTCIVIQALINMFVVVGLLPVTGMTFPFFSLGGSAMLVNLLMCGILINISRKNEKKQVRFYG